MLKDIKNFSLPEVEEKVLEKWEKEGTMKKSFEKNRGEKEFVFYEGPPTANGKPGIHHLEARAFKDIITRFKAMQGFHVPRKAGWDTHGLPVEIAVEKALNLKDKQAIEDYGIDKFNAQAKELVFAHLQDWQDFTKRIAFWVDMENPYVTYHNSYIESLWWLFSEINERGYLKKLQKTLPWCPRCQTALSSHELAQPGAYREVTDPSIYVKFPLAEAKSDKPIANSYLLVWTTTPWTLPGNLAVAVDPKLEYKKFEVKNASNSEVEYLISYNQPPEIEGFEVKEVEKISGQELIGLKYQSPFNLPTDALNKLKGHKLHEVWVGDFVTTEDGSGLVHIAPAFGEEDFRLMGIKENLPVTITEKIEMAQGFPGAGKYVKEADRDIVKDLEGRNLLYKFSRIKHEYPHCWRCDNPLFYVVRESWFIEMSQLQKQLIKGNEKINWVPSHIKEGRFGNWLSEIKDWSISRNRYWGTPLPIWVSEDEKEKFVVSSLEDLQKYSPNQNTFYLLRHGEARANIEHVVAAGPEDSPEHTSDLTELGEKQVAQVAKELKKEEIDLIFASPYLRTKKTAQATAKEIGKEVAFDDRLKEIDGGKLNWQPLKEYWALFKDDQEKFDKAPEGGESLADARKRVLEFYKELNEKYKNKKILIVAHGGILRLIDGINRGLEAREIMEETDAFPHDSFKEIKFANRPLNQFGELDLHRPYIDQVKLAHPRTGKSLQRIEDVADVWFDSGAMPYASQHFPFNQEKKGLKALKEIPFPADYISEAVDQTRGWFYTLHAIAVLLGQPQAYKNVVCLGLISDKEGKKMSKSKGNVINPNEMINKYGSDMVRWYFYTMNNPGDSKNFNEDDLAKTSRKIATILYNSFSFFNTYGQFTIENGAELKSENILDKWIMAELYDLSETISDYLDNYKITEAGRRIESFIDGLSRWYIRRSRSRFQDATKSGQQSEDYLSASRTLQYVFVQIAKIMAPFTPFLAEALYQSASGVQTSVHLENWTQVDKAFKNPELIENMQSLRDLSTNALALRAEAGIKVRQPLSSLTLKDQGLEKETELLEILKNEANVKEIKFDSKLENEKGLELDQQITPELKEEGMVREITRAIQGLRQKANLDVKERIKTIQFNAPETVTKTIDKYAQQIIAAVGAENIEHTTEIINPDTDTSAELKIDDGVIGLGLAK